MVVLVVEPVRTNDIGPVARLAMEALKEQYDLDWLADQASGKGTFLVARDVQRNQVVGFAVANQSDCEGHLLALAVRPQRRGEGIGQALLGHVRQQLACSGAMRMQLEVRADDPEAQVFYRRQGFEPTGLQSQVYADGGDAIVMTKPL